MLKEPYQNQVLKKDLKRAWETMLQKILCVICDDVPRQLKDVIENNDGHIEINCNFFCNINTI